MLLIIDVTIIFDDETFNIDISYLDLYEIAAILDGGKCI